MRIETVTGVRGELIEYRAEEGAVEWGKAIVLRDDPTFPEKPYSTHEISEHTGVIYAGNGHYDLTLEEARADFARR